MINDQIDRYLTQEAIPNSLRPALRDFARTIADIARRTERREIIASLCELPKGALVADLSLSLAHSLASPGPLRLECRADSARVNTGSAILTVQP